MAPETLDGYRCYLEQARERQDWESSARRLEGLLGDELTRGGAGLFLAAVLADRGGEGVLSLYRDSAEHFAETGHAAGEVAARTALVGELCTRQEVAEAEAEASRAAAVAEGTGMTSLLARARLAQAKAAKAQEQVSRAWALAREAEGMLLPNGPVELQVELFRLLGFLRWTQRKEDEALRDFQRSVELATRAGDYFTAAMTRYSAAFIEANQLFEEGLSGEEALVPMKKALVAAERTGNLAAELRCRLILGQASSNDEALGQFRRASELAEILRDFDRGLFATRFYAYALLARSPERREEILGLLAKTLELARAKGDLEQVIPAQIGLANTAWILGDESRALEVAQAAFEAIERARSLQRLDEVRLRWHSRYEFFYKRTSGWLLQRLADGSGSSADLDRALAIMERFRGRVLLDVLENPENSASREKPLGRHAELLHGITAVQKRLRDPDLAEDERKVALEELDRLEVAEAAQRVEEELAPDGTRGSYFVPRVSLEGLQRALRPGEALLAFQLHNRELIMQTQFPDSGSWSILATRRDWAVRALPDQEKLEGALGIYLGLVERADGSEAEAAMQLYEELFRGVLETLPDTVHRLILVLDPILERAPLGTLRASREGEPLAGRFELARVPSIATFLRFRRRPTASHSVPVLALADPSSPGQGSEERTAMRSALLTLGDPLKPLPYARKEGRSLVRRLGRGSLLRQGEQASESWLKREDLSRFSILHFGAHAVVDNANPERSAVVLAAGDESEDGLLQSRDLAELELDGQLVVLAACRSAAGDLVAGEGAMGLSRSFLLAGARTVVASLWPLQDDFAADLFGRFYGHLAEGVDVSAALQATQRELWQEGVPAKGWAGVVVMGDGSQAPVSPVPAFWPIGSTMAVLAALGLVGVGAFRSKAVRREQDPSGGR